MTKEFDARQRQHRFSMALITSTIIVPSAMAVACYVQKDPENCPEEAWIAQGGASCMGAYQNGGPRKRVGNGNEKATVTAQTGVCLYRCDADNGQVVEQSIYSSLTAWGTCPSSGSGGS